MWRDGSDLRPSCIQAWGRHLGLPALYNLSGFPGGAAGEEPACHAGDLRDVGSIPGSGRFPGGGHGNPLQYSCLENPMDRGAWRATAHRVSESSHVNRYYD